MTALRLPDVYLRQEHWTGVIDRSPVIAIRATDLTLPEIEVAILQTLALGRVATLDETLATSALAALGKGPEAIRVWADAFVAEYQAAWTHRPLFADLMFTLADEEEGNKGTGAVVS